ncbi:MAG: peroxiredoxin [Nitrospiraceae bacterium]|jgi:peroxiredoxin|nr:peroxiredoxin [Nitrospiraceae bacterium]
MPIKVGDPVPAATFKQLSANGIANIDTATLLKGRKVVLFGLPGAYTPVCSANHLPGFVAKADDLKAKGIDDIACISVNDPFVMQAWGKQHGADGKVTMLSDADGAFTRAIGLSLDLPEYGLNGRSERYSMVVENGVVKTINVEKTVLDHGVSSAANCMLHT